MGQGKFTITDARADERGQAALDAIRDVMAPNDPVRLAAASLAVQLDLVALSRARLDRQEADMRAAAAQAATRSPVA